MDFLNLSLGELATLAGLASAVIVALYLMERSKRRQVVATLRFWAAGKTPEELQHKRRIHQPWSLLLQLLSVLLLLAAIAEPFIGGRNAARDHVLVLDTSAWMGARTRQGTLLDQAKTAALTYLDAVPASDLVMLVRADALATPVTQFEANHQNVAQAIRRSQASTSALNLEQAIEFSQRAQRLQSRTAGEIVFVGAGRVSREDAELIAPPSNLRLLSIPSTGENVGIRKLAVRRAAAAKEPNGEAAWEVFAALHNDGTMPREVALELQFAGSPIGAKTRSLAPGADSQDTFQFRARTGGLIEARVRSTNGRADAFPQDDRAAVELPVQKKLRVTAYTNEPELLKPLLGDQEYMDATIASTASYKAQSDADVVVLDRFAPAQPPTAPSIWIEPPAGSPFQIRGNRNNTKLDRWRAESPLATGLSTKDAQLASTEIFALPQGDQAVAETADGPVIITRSTPVKMVAFGFHPLRSAMKYDLATPLLMANALRWMTPDVFRRAEAIAGTVGTVTVPLEKNSDHSAIRVLDANQKALPYTFDGDQLRFFSGAPGNVRVVVGDRETTYALSLPDVGDTTWTPSAQVARGVPRFAATSSPPTVWPWLAFAGAAGFFADWLLFGRKRMVKVKARTASPEAITWRKAS